MRATRDLTVLRPSGLSATVSLNTLGHTKIDLQTAKLALEAVRSQSVRPIRPRGRLFEKVALGQRVVALAASGPGPKIEPANSPDGRSGPDATTVRRRGVPRPGYETLQPPLHAGPRTPSAAGPGAPEWWRNSCAIRPSYRKNSIRSGSPDTQENPVVCRSPRSCRKALCRWYPRAYRRPASSMAIKRSWRWRQRLPSVPHS